MTDISGKELQQELRDLHVNMANLSGDIREALAEFRGRAEHYEAEGVRRDARIGELDHAVEAIARRSWTREDHENTYRPLTDRVSSLENFRASYLTHQETMTKALASMEAQLTGVLERVNQNAGRDKVVAGVAGLAAGGIIPILLTILGLT